MTESSADSLRAVDPIVVVGDRTINLDSDAAASVSSVTRQVTVVCATGHRERATWTGVEIASLCDAVDAPPETTHVLVESHDEYRMAVPIADALNGLVAFEKNGRPLSEAAAYDSRFVAPGVEGARDVKGVRRIEFHALDPSSDPDALENVEPADDRFEPERDE